MKKILKALRGFFPRPVRVTLYLGGTGAIAAEITAANLPVWSSALATPLLLALLHLNPADVEDDPAPDQD